jgi:hypothetical protein
MISPLDWPGAIGVAHSFAVRIYEGGEWLKQTWMS